MTLRTKIALAQVPLVLALGVLAVLSLATVTRLGRSAESILEDNYRSVLCAQRMRDALERIDHTRLATLASGQPLEAPPLGEAAEVFEAELAMAADNITEPGETEAVAALRSAWARFRESVTTLDALAPQERRSWYFEVTGPLAREVRAATHRVLTINQDAMVLRSEAARRTADRTNELLIAGALVALLLGFATSLTLTSRLLRPLESLGQAARRLAEGDLEARAQVRGRDEIATVGREFNAMAEHLGHYRRSSLGDLLRAQQAARAAIDSLPDPVVMLNLDGTVLDVNRAAEDQLGIRLDASGADPLAGVDPAIRSVLAAARDHVVSGRGPFAPRGFDEAVAIMTADGATHLLPRATALYGESHAIVGVTVLLHDVTRLHRFDELRNDLVATVAHQFRTPLTSLRLAIHLCYEGAAGPVTEKQADLMFAAREDCERLQGIVDDLLDVARLQAGNVALRPEAVSPEVLRADLAVAHAAEARQRGVTLEVQSTPSLPFVRGDAERLALVLTNLTTNALRHTPSGGVVRVEARPDVLGVCFRVLDTGPGVPEEYRTRIFERFFQVPDGLHGRIGLGLSIAKDIVLAHSGSIGVDAREGGGSAFWFTVPAVPDAPG